jgi:hypothetical protein
MSYVMLTQGIVACKFTCRDAVSRQLGVCVYPMLLQSQQRRQLCNGSGSTTEHRRSCLSSIGVCSPEVPVSAVVIGSSWKCLLTFSGTCYPTIAVYVHSQTHRRSMELPQAYLNELDTPVLSWRCDSYGSSADPSLQALRSSLSTQPEAPNKENACYCWSCCLVSAAYMRV